MKIEKITNYIQKIIAIIFLVIVSFLFVNSVFSSAIISTDAITEHTFFLKDNLLRNVMIIIVFIVLMFIMKKSEKVEGLIHSINTNKKVFNIVKISLFLIIFVFCITYVLLGKFAPGADQYTVQEIAGDILKGNFVSMNKGEYLDRYPFQTGLALLSSIFSLIFGANNYIALCITNCVFIIFICYELVSIFDELGFSHFIQICILLSFIIFPVLLFYSYFIYGTIPGLAFAILAFKYEIKYFKDSKIYYLLISVLGILIAQFFKTNYEIFAIAMIIYAAIKITKRKEISKILIIILLCATMMIQSFLPIVILETISNKKIEGGISSYAYFAMAMQDSERAPGWYNGFVNDSYDASNHNTKLQKELAVKEIKKRKKYFDDNKEEAMEFYNKKISSLWNNSSFQSLWNLEDKFSEPGSTPTWIKWMAGKRGNNIISKLLDIVMMLVYLGAFLCGIYLLKQENATELLFFAIFFIGGFIFHLMWEGKAQYTFVYFIFLIALSIIGYMKLLTEPINKISIYKIIGCVILVAFIVLVNFSNYLYTDNDQYYEYMYYNQETNQ